MTGAVLFLHSADAANTNAQAKNVQGLLAHWPDAGPRAAALSFAEVAPEIAGRPGIINRTLSDGRLWPWRVALEMQADYRAIVAPGLHIWADWLGVWMRKASGRSVPLITTVEGLLGAAPDATAECARYAGAAGHAVYCQPVAEGTLRRRRRLHRQATHIIAISPFLARMTTLDHPGKVSTLPLGIDDGVFHARGRSRRDRPLVMAVGNVRAHKRPGMMLDLAARFGGADFVWYGEGELRAELSEAAARRRLANLRFPGALAPAALAECYRSADVLVIPSRAEGVPKVSQEAAACGVAQVLFGFYEAPSVIDGVNGFVVWDDAAMAARVGELIDDAALSRRMGDAGAEMARDWPWRVVAQRWRRRILEVIGAS